MKSSFFYSITNSRLAYELMLDHISSLQEEVWVIALNTRKHPIKVIKVFKGSLNFCSFHFRDIFREVINANAHSFILCHSHPSGSASPSTQDKMITKNLIQSSKILQIPIEDHLILAKTEFYSFTDEKLHKRS